MDAEVAVDAELVVEVVAEAPGADQSRLLSSHIAMLVSIPSSSCPFFFFFFFFGHGVLLFCFWFVVAMSLPLTFLCLFFLVLVLNCDDDAGVFVARGGKEDLLVTRNLVPGESVYGEKRVSVETPDKEGTGTEKIEYRVWNPFRSKLAAAILGGVGNIHMEPGSKVLYLGAASGTTVSHVADLVGKDGVVYAVEFSHRAGRDLIGMAKRRTNVVPIIEDARHPHKYRMLVPMVDCVFADVAQPDQVRIVALNSDHFLKNGGHFVISIKASCVDSTAPPTAVFASEVKKMKELKMKPKEQLTLEPYERDHAVVVGVYRFVLLCCELCPFCSPFFFFWSLVGLLLLFSSSLSLLLFLFSFPLFRWR